MLECVCCGNLTDGGNVCTFCQEPYCEDCAGEDGMCLDCTFALEEDA